MKETKHYCLIQHNSLKNSFHSSFVLAYCFLLSLKSFSLLNEEILSGNMFPNLFPFMCTC